MASEDELRDAQIEKTKVEADLAREQLRELERGSHFVRRIGQGIGVGVVLALAGMALFGPIKDTIEAEGKLAALNASIADRTNVDLQQRLDERQKQLEAQEASYGRNLAQLAEDLKKANAERDAAIARAEDLAAQEKALAEKFSRLAAQQQDNAELIAQAKAANERAKQLETEITGLKLKARTAEAEAAVVQAKVDVRSLSKYLITLGMGEGSRTLAVQERLEELGLAYGRGRCLEGPASVSHYADADQQAASLLARALAPAVPDMQVNFVDISARRGTLWICAF